MGLSRYGCCQRLSLVLRHRLAGEVASELNVEVRAWYGNPSQTLAQHRAHCEVPRRRLGDHTREQANASLFALCAYF